MTAYVWLSAAVGAVIVLLIVIVCCSHIVVDGFVTRRGSDDYAEVRVKALFGLVRYRSEIPVIYLKGPKPELVLKGEHQAAPVASDLQDMISHIDAEMIERFYHRIMDALRFTRNLTGLAKKLAAKVKLTKWEWSTSVGTGDAVWTAMTTGIAWSVQSAATGIISQYMRLRAVPRLTVEPKFNVKTFETMVAWTAKIRVGHLLFAGAGLIGRILKVRGGLQGWKEMLMKPQPGGA